MTQSTMALIDAHEADHEVEELRAYQRVPRPFRKRRETGRRRRTAKLSINGRNTSRSTGASLRRAKLAMKLQTGGA
jgi:hypothetical protein